LLVVGQKHLQQGELILPNSSFKLTVYRVLGLLCLGNWWTVDYYALGFRLPAADTDSLSNSSINGGNN